MPLSCSAVNTAGLPAIFAEVQKQVDAFVKKRTNSIMASGGQINKLFCPS
jgi:hypothetical protein